MRRSAGRNRSSVSTRSHPGGGSALVDVDAQHLGQQELAVLPDRERRAHPVPGHLAEQPVETGAQVGRRGGRRPDVADRRKRLQGRVEVDRDADDDVVSSISPATPSVVSRAWPLTTAKNFSGSSMAACATQGPASPSRPNQAADLDEIEHLGQVITEHARTIAQQIRTDQCIDLSGTNVVVTGGHVGLALETTRALGKAGASSPWARATRTAPRPRWPGSSASRSGGWTSCARSRSTPSSPSTSTPAVRSTS